jgi:hypothetical protein
MFFSYANTVQLLILLNNLKVMVGLELNTKLNLMKNIMKLFHIRFKETDARLQQETLVFLV